MARVWRDGQKRKVHIYRLLTTVSAALSSSVIIKDDVPAIMTLQLQGTIEEKIYQRQISKSGLAEVMEAGAGSGQATVRFSTEDLKVHSIAKLLFHIVYISSDVGCGIYMYAGGVTHDLCYIVRMLESNAEVLFYIVHVFTVSRCIVHVYTSAVYDVHVHVGNNYI